MRRIAPYGVGHCNALLSPLLLVSRLAILEARSTPSGPSLKVALGMWPISPLAGRGLIGLLACVHEIAAISECQGGPRVCPRRELGAPRCPSFLSNSHAALKEKKNEMQ